MQYPNWIADIFALRRPKWYRLRMVLDRTLLDILVCPETKEPLALLSDRALQLLNAMIREGRIKNRAGSIVQECLDAGLLRTDRKFVYPVRRDIPVMLIDEALSVEEANLSE
ncbi:MAG: hypothetical protein EBZ48_03280 [Proteobacteria bacterium]|nr:hypothetical protein [Pseudomonadota bacterium]